MRETDMLVGAPPSGPRPPGPAPRPLEVVVEDKGCWNKGVLTQMRTQLVDTYLAQTGGGAGVYVVFAFACVASGSNRRCPTCSRMTVEELRAELESQAAALSADGLSVHAVVLDCRLGPPAARGSAPRP